MFNQVQWWKNYLSKDYLSLNIIKHNCSWHNKFVVYIYIYTPAQIPSSVQLSTWGRLEGYATNNFYTFCYMLVVLKSFLWAKQNLTVVVPKILKLRRSSLIKIAYNQFLLLKYYRLCYWIRSFIWFIPTNLESVIFD